MMLSVSLGIDFSTRYWIGSILCVACLPWFMRYTFEGRLQHCAWTQQRQWKQRCLTWSGSSNFPSDTWKSPMRKWMFFSLKTLLMVSAVRGQNIYLSYSLLIGCWLIPTQCSKSTNLQTWYLLFVSHTVARKSMWTHLELLSFLHQTWSELHPSHKHRQTQCA